MPNYSGMWTLQAQMQAAGQKTWPNLPIDPGLWVWGTGNAGALGLNSQTNFSSPVQVGALTNWNNMGAAGYSSYSVKTDGTLWSWGQNSRGELGQNDRIDRSSPVQVGALTTWSIIAAGEVTGDTSAIAIRTNGTMWSWGFNSNGQLGLGDVTNRSSPVQIGALTNWSKVDIGNAFFISVKTDGTLWACGRNNFGQLGQNNLIYRSSPVQVGALTNWSNISCGRRHVIAVKTDGTVWSWGHNQYGQIGDGTIINRSSPVQVGALTTWLRVTASGYSSFAINSSEALWSWGYNFKGELGQNDRVYRSSPVQVGSSTWSYVYASTNTTSSIYAVRANGTLWSWGENDLGQLGDSTEIARSSPVQIGEGSNWAKAEYAIGSGTNFAIATVKP